MDLLMKMLEVNPQARPSAAECLTHDFFIENDNSANLGDMAEDEISEKLKNFQQK